MHERTLDGSAPLYGRVSQTPGGKFPIEQLGFDTAREFFPEYSPGEQVFTYGVFGGVPHYLPAVGATESLDRTSRGPSFGNGGASARNPS